MAVIATNTETKTTGAQQMMPSVRMPVNATLSRLSEADRRTLEQVLGGQAEYIRNDLFCQRDTEVQLFGAKAELVSPNCTTFRPMPVPREEERIHDGVTTLSSSEEKALFLRYNYARYRAYRLLESHAGKRLPAGQTRLLLAWSQRCLTLRAEIVRANIPLVLAMAKRTRLVGVDFSELISEGNMALLRSADKFDCGRGFKFSTYACRAILKGFSRVAMRTSRYRGRFPTEFDPSLEKSDFVDRKRESAESDCVDELRLIITANRAELNDVEMTVIRERFAWPKVGRDEESPKTLEQVGAIIGVTKERVRQIQNKALGKIREVLEDDFLAA